MLNVNDALLLIKENVLLVDSVEEDTVRSNNRILAEGMQNAWAGA